MNLNKLIIIALFCLTQLLTSAVFASATASGGGYVPIPVGGGGNSTTGKPGRPGLGRNGATLALALAIEAALTAADWVIEEGTKVNKPAEVGHPNGVPAEVTPTSGVGAGTGSPRMPGGSYPYEFLIFDKLFDSHTAAHEYVITTGLRERKLVRTRRPSDGLDYDEVKVYFGKQGYGRSKVGYFVSYVQAEHENTKSKNRIGGSVHSFSGEILYKGTDSKETIDTSEIMTDALKAAAAEHAANTLASALPEEYEPVPIPGKETPESPVPDLPWDPVTFPEPANDPVYDPAKPDKVIPFPTPTKPEEKPKEDDDDTPVTVPQPKPEEKPKEEPTTKPSPVSPPMTVPRPATPDDLPKPHVEPKPDAKPNEKPNPDAKPEENPNANPRPTPVTTPNPQGQPQPSPQPNPQGQPQPNPQGQPHPSPTGSPSPSSPTGSPSPSSPQGQPQPSPTGAPQPQGGTGFQLPKFCDWAKVVCDFLDNEEEDENNDFKFQDNDDKKPDTDFSFGGRCPANVVINGSLGPVKINFVLMEWTKFCSILTNYIKPAVIVIASYLAVLILAGRNESN